MARVRFLASVLLLAAGCAAQAAEDPREIPSGRGGDTNRPPTPPAREAGPVPSTDGATDRLPPGPTPGEPACLRTATFEPPVELLQLPTGSGVPRLSPDELTLYVSAPTGLVAGAKSDLFRATRGSTSERFGPLQPLAGLSSSVDDRDPTPSTDGLLLFFHSSRDSTTTGADIFVSSRASLDVEFGAPKKVVEVSTNVHEAHPFFRTNGAELYFSRELGVSPASNREIMRSQRLANGTFSEPKPVTEINSPKADYQPMVTEDGLTMIFASQRDGTKGDHDLWIAERGTEVAPWQTPKNIAELNTDGLEYAGEITADRCRLYFSRVPKGSTVHSVMVAGRPRAAP